MGVKCKYFLAHLLMDSMDHMQECTHESNLIIEENRSKNKEGIVDKRLDYFKCRNKIANETQMNMVNAITSLTNVIKEILKVCDKSKEPFFQNKTLMHITKRMHNMSLTCI
jgi:hypothetical protein